MLYEFTHQEFNAVDCSEKQFAVQRTFLMTDQALVFSLKRQRLAIFIFGFGLKSARSWGAALMISGVLLISSAPPVAAATAISATARRESQAIYQQAYAAYTSGDLTQSLSLLDRAETIRPDFADCLNLRGIIYLRQEVYDKAETAFTRAVALDANLWAAQFNLGEIPFRQKNYALARARFEKLLSHTNRFKAGNQWELVQYKTFLCALLAGNDSDAQKNLARLPQKGGATPAFEYAQAALALSKKDGAGASKWLTIAQAGYPPALNNLFADSLALAGWSSALPGRTALTLAGGPAGSLDPRRAQAAYLDPRLEAAAAEPLPAADGGVLPMLPQGRRPAFSLLPETDAPSLRDQVPVYVPAAPAPTPAVPVSGLDNGGLLLLH